VRFDDADQLALDVSRSEGVLGSTYHGSSLYIALDPAHARSVVTLRDRAKSEAERLQSEMPPPSLVDSRWQLSGLTRNGCDFEVTAQGYGPGDMTWQTTPRRTFRVSAVRDASVLSEDTRAADENGLLRIRIEPSAIEPLQVRFTCHEQAQEERR
jgi:hypothetical protein